jgi:DNA polymerase IV
VFVVPTGEEPAFLAPLPLRALWGVGPKTAERLQQLGLETLGQLASQPLSRLTAEFGLAHGQALFDHSHGRDDSELQDEREPKSYSAEHTFQRDTRDRAELWNRLRAQAVHLSERLGRHGLCAAEVGIKVRYADWTSFTRQVRLPVPTADAEVFARTAALLMRRHWETTRPVRLIGLRAARLRPADSVTQLAFPGV